MQQIGFIGVGNMGFQIVNHLIHAGYAVTVYDKNDERMAMAATINAKCAKRAADVIAPGGIVITMLPDDDALTDVLFGQNGIIDSLGPTETHISMSTVSPATIRQVHTAHQNFGTQFLSAPVLGRPDTVREKKLWAFLSGNSEIKQNVNHIFTTFCQGVFDFGEEIAAANIAKLTANFFVFTLIEAMGEAFSFVEKSGLDTQAFADMIVTALFPNPIFKHHANSIVSRNFTNTGFRLSLCFKDICLLLQCAHDVNMPMPIVALLYNRLLGALSKGREDLEWTAVTLSSFEEAGILS